MSIQKNGILIRFPLMSKKEKTPTYPVSFAYFLLSKIAEGINLGYKCFIFEITDSDFNILDFNITEDLIKRINNYLENNIRVGFYIKSKKYLTSDLDSDVKLARENIEKCLEFTKKIDITDLQEFPIILHIGGAKGDRRKTMEVFCNNIIEYFKDDIGRLSVVNDEKPSLFSVKDLLSGIFYKIKIPIVFRSTSYPTNQGNLTLNESLFLSASTWKRNINPLFIYLPGENILNDTQIRPFGLELDFVFDNILPEP